MSKIKFGEKIDQSARVWSCRIVDYKIQPNHALGPRV